MALEYKFLFVDEAPELFEALYMTLHEHGLEELSIEGEDDSYLIKKLDDVILTIDYHKRSECLNFSFGEYCYNNLWYVDFNKVDLDLSNEVFYALIKEVVVDYKNSFVVVFNGELVIIRKDNGKIYLNTEGGFWNIPERLELLHDVEYHLINYPVV